MDAFYASVEQRDQPHLRDKPVIVGGDPKNRGVVSSASYEARKFGVRSAMSCSQAQRLCPQGIFIFPNFTKYVEASRRIREILETVTSQIEPLALGTDVPCPPRRIRLFRRRSSKGCELLALFPDQLRGPRCP